MGTRREITAAVVDRYRSAGRMDKGRILDELCAVTGWHRKHAVRALASHVRISPEARRQRSPTYGATIRDALVALWESLMVDLNPSPLETRDIHEVDPSRRTGG
jgi:hypothetical protein